MKRHFIIGLMSLFVFFSGALLLKGQIIGRVIANIHHPFTIVNTTLPPGTYVFKMLKGTDETAMTVHRKDGGASVEFLVNRAKDLNAPHHTELVFNRYGNREILEKIFEQGDKNGVSVAEPSRAESRAEAKGEHPVTHSETESGA